MRRAKEKLTKGNAQEIEVLKKTHEELEATVTNSCQRVLESTVELDAVAKAKKLGVVIEQQQSETSILDALIHPSTPPEHIAARKDEIEELDTQLDELEKDAKKVTDSTTQVWGSIVQDEQIEQVAA